MPNAMGMGRHTVGFDLKEAPSREEKDSLFCSDLLSLLLELAENGRRRTMRMCGCPAAGRRIGRRNWVRIVKGVRIY
jgi:hypothetical protein